MAPTPGYSRYEDLVRGFTTTTEMNLLLRDLQRMTTPSDITFEPTLTVNVTTLPVTPAEVILTRVRSSYISKKNYFMYNDL